MPWLVRGVFVISLKQLYNNPSPDYMCSLGKGIIKVKYLL